MLKDDLYSNNSRTERDLKESIQDNGVSNEWIQNAKNCLQCELLHCLAEKKRDICSVTFEQAFQYSVKLCVTCWLEFMVSGKKTVLINSNYTCSTSQTNHHVMTLLQLTWKTCYSESSRIHRFETKFYIAALHARLIEEIRSVAKGMFTRTWVEQDYCLDAIRTIRGSHTEVD
jgi:hypothetical protein